jgi:hypothetical protein
MVNGRLFDAATMNEIGNYNKPRSRFYWEIYKNQGVFTYQNSLSDDLD